MNKKIVIFYTLLTLVIGGVIGFLITSKTQNTVSSTDTVQENLNDKKIVSGYSFEKTNKNIINKEFDGDYLDSFVTNANRNIIMIIGGILIIIMGLFYLGIIKS